MRFFIIILSIVASIKCNVLEYYVKRDKLVETENLLTVGGNYSLDLNETVVNNCLMQNKFKELDYAFDNPQYFNFSHHFFVYKNKMRESKVYKIIKDMPKGAALHVHDMAMLGPDYMLNITYMDHLYLCFGSHPKKISSDHLYLQFANKKPNGGCNEWQLISQARQKSENITSFDESLRKHFTVVVKDPDIVYPGVEEIWLALMNYFSTVYPLLTYRPVWEQYLYDVFNKLREDNIMYVEVRSTFPKLYELNGTSYDRAVTAKSYQKAVNQFKKDYPDFEGAKVIFATSRFGDTDVLASNIETAKSLKDQVPELFAGFDLIGHEDKGGPLIQFVPKLLEADLDYFLHAGETDWYGTMTDGNLYDAILLGTKRIGHAYALTKHPLLMKEVLAKDIGLEVNLISNVVLSLVRDLRNHPLNTFIANGMPVVLSSDDPGAWEAEPLSDDFYVAFVGASSRLSDLRLLKALGENSLIYSALASHKKNVALRNFHMQWKRFIDNFNCSKY